MPTLSISPEKVAYLIIKTREFDVQDANSDPDSGSNAIDDGMTDVLEDHGDNPVRQEFRAFVGALDIDEKADLIALMQLGRYFFFNDTATTEIYTLSLHDALPI